MSLGGGGIKYPFEQLFNNRGVFVKRHWIRLLPVVSLFVACEGRAILEESPVFQPPPQRTSLIQPTEDRGIAEDRSNRSAITPVSRSWPAPGAAPGVQGEVVALVNGEPVFADDLLLAHGEQLRHVQQTASPEEYKRFRLQVMRQKLPTHIERMVAVQALRSSLKEEQLEMLDEQLDEFAGQHLDQLMEQVGVTSRVELRRELEESGTTPEMFVELFKQDQIARQYLMMNVEQVKKADRTELLEWYRAHLDEYRFEERVRWQRIVINKEKHGRGHGARDVLRRVVHELANGVDFGEVAKNHSDGPMAANGGRWGDWMERNSLADEEVDEALFSMKVGEISRIFSTPGKYEIVRVVERRDAGQTTFESVQDDIEQRLLTKKNTELRQRFVQDLIASAEIRTIFDDPGLSLGTSSTSRDVRGEKVPLSIQGGRPRTASGGAAEDRLIR